MFIIISTGFDWLYFFLQLTQKKSSLQFKALDQVLQTINKETGEKQALTYKCADIDRIIPTIMGVSKVGAIHLSRRLFYMVPGSSC